MFLVMTLTLLGAGCASTTSDSAICDGTKQARTAHAAALADSDDDAAVLTGARLLALMKAGCG